MDPPSAFQRVQFSIELVTTIEILFDMLGSPHLLHPKPRFLQYQPGSERGGHDADGSRQSRVFLYETDQVSDRTTSAKANSAARLDPLYSSPCRFFLIILHK